MAISYAKFKRTFGDLGITEWVKFNWLSNAGIARKIYNKVVEAGYDPLAYVNDELYNHFEGEKFLVLVGDVDLGTLDWTYNSSFQCFISPVIGLKPNDYTSYNLLCPKYTTNPLPTSQLPDKSIRYAGGTNVIFVKDTSYNDVSAFKAANSGVPLYYELATPVLIDL